MPFGGVAGGYDFSGGMAGAGAVAGSAGYGGTAGNGGCNPSRAGAAPAAGAAGGPSKQNWYVDVKGDDQWPGTMAFPLKTLSCASLVAGTGDTVFLSDGTWDGSVDSALMNTQASACGPGSGIAFAPDVMVRAVNPGAARIVSQGIHGLCMQGGIVEGIRFDCSAGYPVLETKSGVLEIIGSSLHKCGTYGFDLAGSAQVTMYPGTLTDYSESPNHYFARVREQATLSIEGGKISFSAYAIQVGGTANLEVHGVTFTANDNTSLAGYGVSVSEGSPTITLDEGTLFDKVAVAVDVTHAITALNIDDVTIMRGANAVSLNQETDATVVPKIDINRLNVLDNSGLGVSASGRNNLTIKNSNFTRCSAPTIMPTGTGTVLLDTVTVTDSWGGILAAGQTGSSGLAVTVRNYQATGCQYAGVFIAGYTNDTFDFGTAASPGNNVFRGNNLIASGSHANFVFQVASGGIVYAVGNTWDADVQGADADGKYSVGAGLSLDVTSGAGVNFYVDPNNAGKMRLAESP